MCRYINVWSLVECYIGQVIELTFGGQTNSGQFIFLAHIVNIIEQVKLT